MSSEPGVLGLLHYILGGLIRSPNLSSPPAQRGGQSVYHVHFPTQVNLAGAFGYVRSVERDWGIRDPSVAHEHRLLHIQLKTDTSTCFVEFCQHSFRLADARSYQRNEDSVNAGRQLSLPCHPIKIFASISQEWQ
ncbi:hypothetical protein RB195_025265 [Necator americanus]|uniref:Uncharacterized protein n=1 Tax=Necator americanus TaxID=51031 RepID=A0ABR1ERJ9_NECAM